MDYVAFELVVTSALILTSALMLGYGIDVLRGRLFGNK